MKNEPSVNRRLFFGRSIMRILDTVCSGCLEEPASAGTNDEDNALPALLGDLSPELLMFEAQRLGVDPGNKQEIVERLRKEMLSSKQ